MSLKDYMRDQRIIDALQTLATAVDASLQDCGTDLKTILVVVLPAAGKPAGAVLGCDCPGCKAVVLDGAARICTSSVDPTFVIDGRPETMVH